jgi:cell cycle sensor histidine kinase DivJ
MAAAATLALAGVAGLVGPEPDGLAALALAGAAVIGVTALLGGGVARRRERTLKPSAPAAAERWLASQPALLLGLEPSGAVLGRLWRAPDRPRPRRPDPEQPARRRPPRGPRRRPRRPARRVGAGRAGGRLRHPGRRRAAPAPPPADDGRLVGALSDAAAERDALRRAEAARADAEAASVAKSRFLADMSHELRTPLNAIIGFSDVMRARLFGELPERYRDYPESIHESGRHLLDLINDVLDLSKIEAARYELSLESGDVREPVEAAVRLVSGQAQAAGLTLDANSPRPPCRRWSTAARSSRSP